MNDPNIQAVEEMNALWCTPLFANAHANQIWARVRFTVCYNPLSAHGLFEKQPSTTPVQRCAFIRQLKECLQNLPPSCKPPAIDKMVNQIVNKIFACTTPIDTDIAKQDLLERAVSKSALSKTVVAPPAPWSSETTNVCEHFMRAYGFKEITRSFQADENVVAERLPQIIQDCMRLIERIHIDPYLFGMGAHLSFEGLEKTLGGYASAYGVMALNAQPYSNTNAVFFHEWFHMLDHAAFYAAQYPEACSPLAPMDAPLRALHANLIRMNVNHHSSIDPYNTLTALVENLGREKGHTPQQQLQHIKQMKEVFHASKKDRRENLNAFLHSVVLNNESGGDLYPFIDKGIQTFDVMSVALKGFHKYLQKGYSEFYSVSLQMDDNYYHTERAPLKWYQRRQPYYSKPSEILARSAEQFCAKELGWDLNLQLGYPQLQEARRAHELFDQFFQQLASVRLTPSSPTRKLK